MDTRLPVTPRRIVADNLSPEFRTQNLNKIRIMAERENCLKLITLHQRIKTMYHNKKLELTDDKRDEQIILVRI